MFKTRDKSLKDLALIWFAPTLGQPVNIVYVEMISRDFCQDVHSTPSLLCTLAPELRVEPLTSILFQTSSKSLRLCHTIQT